LVQIRLCKDNSSGAANLKIAILIKSGQFSSKIIKSGQLNASRRWQSTITIGQADKFSIPSEEQRQEI
jgi:hypothetical protein